MPADKRDDDIPVDWQDRDALACFLDYVALCRAEIMAGRTALALDVRGPDTLRRQTALQTTLERR
jgi:hypothetical protein